MFTAFLIGCALGLVLVLTVALVQLQEQAGPSRLVNAGQRPEGAPPTARTRTLRPTHALGANPYGLPTGAPVFEPGVFAGSTAYHPQFGMISTFSYYGEPYRLQIVDGKLVGLPLRTDEVIPVTGGTRLLERRCTACGDALAPDAAFCVSCGHAVAAMVFE